MWGCWGSQSWWFAMVPWRTSLFITDSVNWEEGASSAKAASSASLPSAFLLLTPLPFSPLISAFSARFRNHLFGQSSVHLVPFKSKKHNKTPTLAFYQAHCLAAAVSHKQDHNWPFTTYSFCKLSSVPVSGDMPPRLVNCFDDPKTYRRTSKSRILD